MLHTAATLTKHKQQCDSDTLTDESESGCATEGAEKVIVGHRTEEVNVFVCLGGEKGIRVSSAV